IADKEHLAPRLVITLLDHRHGIHLRKNDMAMAFAETKAMIRQDRTDARGSIRCARLKRIQGSHQEALRYLEHGLCKTSLSDPNFALLDSEIKATREELTKYLV